MLLRSIVSLPSKLRSAATMSTAAPPGKLGKILCSDPIDKECVTILTKAGFDVDVKDKLSKADLINIIPQYRGLIVRSGTKVTADVLAAGKQLELIGRAGTGVDNIDMTAANRLGKVVMNTPGGNTTSAAELTMSMLFATSRSIPDACNSLKAGRWDRKNYMGVELNGKTIGVIGLGRIGREVARWCQAFNMKTIGYDPIMSTEAAREYGIEKVSLDKLYARSDFITIHTPLTPDTANLINKDSLVKCKDGVRIINCARGGIVNELDLLEAIKNKKVAGAAIDAFSQEPPTAEIMELIKHPAVVCTPHLGANTMEAQSKVAVDIANQFVNALVNNEYFGVVNAGYIGLAKQPHVVPYMDLADRLGSMQGQLLDGASVKKLTLNLYGKDITKDQIGDIVSSATLKGLLSHLVDDPVNLVNAPYLAQEHGLQIKINRFAEASRYENAIELLLETDKGKHTLTGTVYQGDTLRVVQIDDFKVEIDPKGNVIMFFNQDKPGVVAAVTSKLAEFNINIANMSLGRTNQAGNALGIVHTDEGIADSIISKLRNLPNMRKVHRLVLSSYQATSQTDGRPQQKPTNPNFGSGPCTKRPGYDLASLPTNLLGRSHRSAPGKARINKATADCKRILGIPDNYAVGIVPASDTGAVEMAMWGLLTQDRPVDVVYMESFGKDWYSDAVKELKLKVNKIEADYGFLPNLTDVNTKDHDVIFTWNGTTSGVKVPTGDWIASERKGLTICDATSAAFAMDLPWDKLDVTTFSWQKVLGGEAAHGVIVASPAAMKRFEESKTNRPWPMPKIFRFTADIFTGNVINTPSMLCVEDFIDALAWAESVGGLEGLKRRSQENLAVIEKFVSENKWISFLAENKNIRSNTSICLKLDLTEEKLKQFVKILEKEGVAFDIGGYRAAPPGIRIWGGSTVSSKDMAALMPWLKFAYEQVQEKK